MLPARTAVPPQAAHIYDACMACLAARDVGNKTFFESGARCFLARFPDPQAWAALPLAARLAGTRPHLQPLLNFLMLHGHLRPGYDYLLERKLTVILREAAVSPLGGELRRFPAGAETLGYSVRARTGMASEVAVRVLIQTGKPLAELTDAEGRAGEADHPGAVGEPGDRQPCGDVPRPPRRRRPRRPSGMVVREPLGVGGDHRVQLPGRRDLCRRTSAVVIRYRRWPGRHGNICARWPRA
jgi:hypothetical protein